MPKLDDQKIAERLEEIIKDVRLKSVRAFALSIGADPSFFSKVLKAERAIPESMVKELGKKYRVDYDWLLYGTGQKYVQSVPHEISKEGAAIPDRGNYRNFVDDYDTPGPNDLTLQALVNLTESNRAMAEAAKKDAETRRIEAENNSRITRAHEELVLMTKEARSLTADDDHKNLLDVGATVMVLRDMVSDLVSEKTGKTKAQVEKDLNIKVDARKNQAAHTGKPAHAASDK